MTDTNLGYTVLVIEDEPSLEEAIKHKLSISGLQADSFGDGNQAIKKIRERGHHYDGIWLDFDILGMNGLQFMQELITIPGWEKCPVLIVSNTGNPSLIQDAIKLGAKDWIVKAEERLDDTIERFVEYINEAQKPEDASGQ